MIKKVKYNYKGVDILFEIYYTKPEAQTNDYCGSSGNVEIHDANIEGVCIMDLLDPYLQDIEQEILNYIK